MNKDDYLIRAFGLTYVMRGLISDRGPNLRAAQCDGGNKKSQENAKYAHVSPFKELRLLDSDTQQVDVQVSSTVERRRPVNDGA